MKKIKYLFFILSILGMVAIFIVEDLGYFDGFKYFYVFKIIFIIMFFTEVVLIVPDK